MGDDYNVFISWSGQRGEWVAKALHDWLPQVVQAAKPWMSTTDIEKGTRGLNEVSNRLQGMKVGIVCLTPEKLNAPWILYEAGALSKTIDDKTRLCTYLLGGLKFQDVEPPLGMFQATQSNKEDTKKLVRTINRAVSDTPVLESNLDPVFERMWPDLEQKLTTMPKSDGLTTAKRSVEDVVTEILEIARAEINNSKSVQAQISHVETILNRAPFGDHTFSSFGEINLLPGTNPNVLTVNPNLLLSSPLAAPFSVSGNQAELLEAFIRNLNDLLLKLNPGLATTHSSKKAEGESGNPKSKAEAEKKLAK